MEESQHAGVRRALRREQQRRKARQGMRVGTRPDRAAAGDVPPRQEADRGSLTRTLLGVRYLGCVLPDTQNPTPTPA